MDNRVCLLVIIGVTEYGTKELVAVEDGFRESIASWEELLIKLREKRIKKKISVYDLFRKLDKVGSGFITHEGWFKHIN